MYGTLLWFHSWWRWAALLAALVALGHACAGALGKRPWTPRSHLPSRICVTALDIQLTVGLILYVFVSPLTSAAFADMGAAMRNPALRFWSMEHGPTMLVAVALFHIGSVRARRASTDSLRFRRLTTWFTLGMALMLAAMPWPWLDIGRPLLR